MATSDEKAGTTIRVSGPGGATEVDIYSAEGYRLLADLWLRSAWQHRISYEPTWLGARIIQLPEDMVMMQELLYKVRPDLIVETGVAHGGSAVFYASICELLGRGRVLSIDVEIRKHNRVAIESHPLSRRITLIEGSSTSDAVLGEVRTYVRPGSRVLVVLDSNHSYAHVRDEMARYAPLVSPGSYLVVFDGVMERLTDAPSGSAAWATDNPATAIREFLGAHEEFEVDPHYNRLGVSYCPSGFLKRAEAPEAP